MSNKNTSSSTSLIGILGLIFITLKLTGFITWSWWWVLLPFYGGIVLVIAFVIGVLAYKTLKDLKSIRELK